MNASKIFFALSKRTNVLTRKYVNEQIMQNTNTWTYITEDWFVKACSPIWFLPSWNRISFLMGNRNTELIWCKILFSVLIYSSYHGKNNPEMYFVHLWQFHEAVIPLNPFHSTGLFWCPWYLWFSDVSRGYQKRPVAWNRLTCSKLFCAKLSSWGLIAFLLFYKYNTIKSTCDFNKNNPIKVNHKTTDVMFVQFKKLLVYNFTKSNTPPRVFFTFFKLYKWYQIVQRITNEVRTAFSAKFFRTPTFFMPNV